MKHTYIVSWYGTKDTLVPLATNDHLAKHEAVNIIGGNVIEQNRRVHKADCIEWMKDIQKENELESVPTIIAISEIKA